MIYAYISFHIYICVDFMDRRCTFIIMLILGRWKCWLTAGNMIYFLWINCQPNFFPPPLICISLCANSWEMDFFICGVIRGCWVQLISWWVQKMKQFSALPSLFSSWGAFCVSCRGFLSWVGFLELLFSSHDNLVMFSSPNKPVRQMSHIKNE